jgi:localization factor PodJL
LAARVNRSEEAAQTGLSDIVRQELARLSERTESVRESSEVVASQAKTAAVNAAQQELRAIESRILGLLNEAQATLGNQASSSDLQRLRADIANLNHRIDEAQSGAASDRDVEALRSAVEQLSARVAQPSDLRPLADIDRRIAELDHRLSDAVRLQGDGGSVSALEHQLTLVSDRLGRAEQQLGHFDTIERAINQLFESLEQNRGQAREAAEDAANRVAERILANQTPLEGPSPEMRALEEGLRAVRESAASSDQRNQETLEAVHETLEQIVNKLAELETAAAGHQLAVHMAQQMEEPRTTKADWPSLNETSGPAQSLSDSVTALQDSELASPAETGMLPPNEPQPQSMESSAGIAEDLEPADDFIAAARRAAQAAATRPNVLHSDIRPVLKPRANSRFSLPLPFRKRGRKPEAKFDPMSFSGGKPMPEIKPAVSNDNKRRNLVLAGLVLLMAVSAFTVNVMMRQTKPLKQSTLIESTVNRARTAQIPRAAAQKRAIAPAVLAEASGLPSPDVAQPKIGSIANESILSDGLLTGALPVKKTEASLTSLIAEPAPSSEKADVPPPEIGSLSLREAASHGDPRAQFIIASRYLDGQNVPQDITRAAYWYQQAASRGLAPAQYRIATLFERGKGVPQDVAAALLWYERAADAGNVKAMHNAAVIAAGNQVGTPNYDKAFRWFSKAAERGLKDSQFNLAVLHERGLGTKTDPGEALFWYSLAGKQGDLDAQKRAGQLAADLAPGVQKPVSVRVASWKPETAMDDANVVSVNNPDWNAPAGASAAHTVATETLPADPVAAAQQLLAQLGFNVGTPDGKMGARTANAIRLFQLQSGMKVTGEATPDLISALQAKAGNSI